MNHHLNVIFVYWSVVFLLSIDLFIRMSAPKRALFVFSAFILSKFVVLYFLLIN